MKTTQKGSGWLLWLVAVIAMVAMVLGAGMGFPDKRSGMAKKQQERAETFFQAFGFPPLPTSDNKVRVRLVESLLVAQSKVSDAEQRLAEVKRVGPREVLGPPSSAQIVANVDIHRLYNNEIEAIQQVLDTARAKFDTMLKAARRVGFRDEVTAVSDMIAK